jgi:hypothetical protein
MNEKMINTHAKLHDLLTQQRQLLMQFLFITKDLAQTIVNDDGNDLLQSLLQRQAIISRVDELLTELVPLWQDYASSPYQEPALAELQEEICGILRETTAIDKKNQLTVLAQMDFLREQMRRLNETRRGAATYIRSAALFSTEYEGY